jgi:cytochrome c553
VAIVRCIRAATFVLLTALVGCATTPDYTPGLGEIMSLQQLRHIKLWFAGAAGNWPLATYELDELKEGFDAAARLYPTHDGMPIAVLLRDLTALPLQQLTDALADEDQIEFDAAFDSLTAACNACHQATEHGFNVLQRPTLNPYSDQVFDAGSPPPG